MHIVQVNLAAADFKGFRVFGILDLGGLFEQAEHLAHIHKCLSDLAVHRAQKVQRHGDLDHIGIDEDKIAYCQISAIYADCGQDHHRDQAAGDQERLPEIQESQ